MEDELARKLAEWLEQQASPELYLTLDSLSQLRKLLETAKSA